MTAAPEKNGWSRWQEWITRSLLAGLVVVGFWQVRVVVGLSNEVAGIKASALTAEDGRAIWSEISALRESVAAMPRERPPKWFVDRVDRLERRFDRLEVLFQKRDREKQ